MYFSNYYLSSSSWLLCFGLMIFKLFKLFTEGLVSPIFFNCCFMSRRLSFEKFASFWFGKFLAIFSVVSISKDITFFRK